MTPLPLLETVLIEIATLAVGELEANCNILHHGQGSECVVVDCGEAEPVAAAIRSLGLKPLLLVATHAHADHIAGFEGLLDEFEGLELGAHPAEAEWFDRPSLNLSYFLGWSIKCPRPARELSDGDVIELGGDEIKVVELPGHSPGSIGLLFESPDGPALVSGDTLFAGGIGRTDLHGGDGAGLMRTLGERVLGMPDETIVLPGHGPATTIGEERRNNPFLAMP